MHKTIYYSISHWNSDGRFRKIPIGIGFAIPDACEYSPGVRDAQIICSHENTKTKRLLNPVPQTKQVC